MSTSENLRNIGIALVVIGVLLFLAVVGRTGFASTALAGVAFISFYLGLILLVISFIVFLVERRRSRRRQIKKIEHTNPLRHRKSLMFIKPKQLKFIKSKSNKKFKLH